VLQVVPVVPVFVVWCVLWCVRGCFVGFCGVVFVSLLGVGCCVSGEGGGGGG